MGGVVGSVLAERESNSRRRREGQTVWSLRVAGLREKEQPHGKGWGRWQLALEMDRDGDRRTGWERKGLVRGTALFGLREPSSWLVTRPKD